MLEKRDVSIVVGESIARARGNGNALLKEKWWKSRYFVLFSSKIISLVTLVGTDHE